MFSLTHLRRFWIVMFLLLALSTIVPATVAAPPADAPSPATLFEQMQHQAQGPLFVHWDETTGVPRFLRGAIPFVPPEAKQTATARALSFFEQYRDLYLMHSPKAELAEMAVQTDKFGMTHVRLQQVVRGVPVWGAQMLVHFDAEGRIRAVNGTYLPGTTVDTTPTIDFAQAVRLARTNLLVDDRAALNQAQSGLVVYRRYGTTALAWKVQIFADNPLGNWTVFVDAHNGAIVHRLDALDTAKNRQTYDAGYGSSLPGTLVCNEADPSCSAGDAAEKAAHVNAGLTYDYYFTKFGRDSYDNAGATLISSAHYKTNYNNAFWNGTQMVYGDGDGVRFSYLSGALDVVAHELTHAVTNLTANLIYENQSGALNESYSDVFGVFAEFYADPAHADWLVGEDVYTPGTPGDALRSMSDPSQGVYDTNDPRNSGGQPDHMNKYAHFSLRIDQGGVHVNSGIPNKAAYLIAHGGTYHGIVVSGIGIAKTEQIYYRTLVHYLTPASSFWDAREASIQSCNDLIGSFGIASTDCNAVQNGFAAVGIGPSSTMTQHAYLPVIQRLSTMEHTPGIYGQVTDAGNPAAGVQLDLRRCVYGGSCTTQATTTTDAYGVYRFTGVPSLSGAYYYVRYLNPTSQATGETPSTLPAGADIQETPAQETLGDVGQFRTPPPQPLVGAAGTTTLLNETFEGSFPSGWTVTGHWGKSGCRAYGGSHSGWIEGASGMSCGSNYHTSEQGKMVFGPFSLSDATAASLTFKLWLKSESSYDALCRLASTDGTTFYGACTTGNSSGWIDRELDLSNVYTLGSLLGRSSVWIELLWDSDSSITYANGAFVDNVVLQKTTSTTGSHVVAWYTDNIGTYTAGTDRRGGNFDIADIGLVSPGDSASLSFPITFDWNRRNAAFPDLYQLELFGSGGSPFGAGSISDYTSSAYTLNALPSGFSTGVQYFWNVLAYGPNGYGVSRYSLRITFTAMANGEIMMV
ncbi:MAG: peptidase M4 family protein, partial [Chloroflexi bacterium]|nr:peptidase M4 family protein [Chloroflexota bacterium]